MTTPTWAQVTAAADAHAAAENLRTLSRRYTAEAALWSHAAMHQSLIETAERLYRIAHETPDDPADPVYADRLHAFAFAGRLQLEHIQSTRRFAYGQPPTVIPAFGGRDG